MRQEFLPYGRQALDDADIEAVAQVLRGDWLTTGPAIAAFEDALAAHVGATYAVACSSGTAALHLAMLALDLGPGDKVVVPAMTFLATANAARLAGADVTFADVDPETALMTADHLRAILDRDDNDGTRAVAPVHFAGQCADPAAIAALARGRGLRIIEDACHALGTIYQDGDGKEFAVGSCSHSDMAVFSFHPVKTIAMGEGGAITTNDEKLFERLKTLRNHGMVHDPSRFTNGAGGDARPWYYEMTEPGLNYRASDIHCALGQSQLGKLDGFVARRRQIAHLYDNLLDRLAPLVKPLGRVPGCDPAWHLYVVLIDFAAVGIDRATVMERLREADIGTQVHYYPVSDQPYYRALYGQASMPGARAYYDRALTLPLFVGLTDLDVERVVGALGKVLAA